MLMTLLGFYPTCGQTTTENTVTDWKGFKKYEFKYSDRQAWYVEPQQALPGKPWVWRAHFPNWHTDMDSILLSRGFHIAYINANDLYGHPKAMQVWDDFYGHLISDKGFSPKVALEGVSRGGLYVYGWAKRNPDKVSCIYAEAPVCDPRSWPGGKGKGEGAPKQWAEWLALYGLTDTQATSFTDYPIQDLKGLAAYKVPILHVVGLSDEVVPVAENTELLVSQYIKLGGPAAVYPMTRGPQKLKGHHFEIENPEKLADFIYNNSVPVKSPLTRAPYLEKNAGLANAFETFTRTKKGTVAFLGGSITHNPGWREKTAQYLQERFPETTFNFIAAGIPSLGSTPHAFRFSKDVLQKGTPDLLFVESAVNDRSNGFSKEAQIRALEGILRQMYTQNPKASVVMMAFADPDKNADYAAGREPVEVLVHQLIAKKYGAAFINLSREVYDRMQAGEFTWEYDFINLHPSPYGQEVYFQTIKTLMRDQQPPAAGAMKLSAPLDKYAYTNGHYVSLEKAISRKGFSIDSAWKPKDKVGTRAGFVDVPMLVAEEAGSSFELDFEGSAVGIAIISGPDAGSISFSIDGKKAEKRDLFTQWSPQLHLPFYLLFADQLKQGKHRLKVEVLDEQHAKSKGHAVRIVHFLVN